MPGKGEWEVRPGWTFLSNHGHVLVVLGRDPQARVRDVAARVGLTERAVLLIIADLEREGIVERIREGRRNRYVLHLEAPLRHPIEQHRTVRELLEMVEGGG
jgi:DNA-binding MarR family transcriptional regulator